MPDPHEPEKAASVQHDPSPLLPLHPLIAQMPPGLRVVPAILGAALLSEAPLPWRTVVSVKTVQDTIYYNRAVQWNDVVAGNQKEELLEKRLRFVTTALINLSTWEQAKLLERSVNGILVGVPVAYLDQYGNATIPVHQNGFPLHRVLWLPGSSDLLCTCGMMHPLPAKPIGDVQARMIMYPNMCSHKELVRLMLLWGLFDQRKEEVIQWTPQFKE